MKKYREIGRATYQVVTSSEFCGSVKEPVKTAKEKSSLRTLGEDHGRCRELGTAPKNLSEYGKRNDKKVINGTGETLPITFKKGNIGIYKAEAEMRTRWKGVGGGHSTADH